MFESTCILPEKSEVLSLMFEPKYAHGFCPVVYPALGWHNVPVYRWVWNAALMGTNRQFHVFSVSCVPDSSAGHADTQYSWRINQSNKKYNERWGHFFLGIFSKYLAYYLHHPGGSWWGSCFKLCLLQCCSIKMLSCYDICYLCSSTENRYSCVYETFRIDCQWYWNDAVKLVW